MVGLPLCHLKKLKPKISSSIDQYLHIGLLAFPFPRLDVKMMICALLHFLSPKGRFSWTMQQLWGRCIDKQRREIRGIELWNKWKDSFSNGKSMEYICLKTGAPINKPENIMLMSSDVGMHTKGHASSMWSAFTQTGDTNKLSHNRNEMNNTRFTWKTLFSGKNHGNRIFHYEKTQNTIMEW